MTQKGIDFLHPQSNKVPERNQVANKNYPVDEE